MRPGDATVPDHAFRAPYAILAFTIGDATGGQATVGRVRVAAPDLEDVSNPWVQTRDHIVRAKTYVEIARAGVLALPTAARVTTPCRVSPALDQSREFWAQRATHPLRYLRDLAADLDVISPQERAVVASLDDSLWGEAVLSTRKFEADNQPYGSYANVLATLSRWQRRGRSVYAPSRELVDRFCDPHLLLDDAVPVVLPFDAFAVLAPAGSRFHTPRDIESGIVLVHQQRASLPVLLPESHRREIDAVLRADDPVAAAVARSRDADSAWTRTVHLGLSFKDHRISNVGETGAWPTWSAWRAEATRADAEAAAGLPGAGERAEMIRLISGLCYALATRDPALRAPDPAPKRRTPPHPCAVVDDPSIRVTRLAAHPTDDATMPLSDTPIVKTVRGPLDTTTLVLARTTHRAYVTTARVGPGRAATRKVVVPAGETRRWTTIKTIAARQRQTALPPLPGARAGVSARLRSGI